MRQPCRRDGGEGDEAREMQGETGTCPEGNDRSEDYRLDKGRETPFIASAAPVSMAATKAAG